MIYDSILDLIGHTPMVRINKYFSDLPGTFLAKMEPFNPGHSTKDRMALKMIQDAEASGQLREGGTIIECTSGNTGMGLAIVAAIKGYKCIFTTNDKQSEDKVNSLRAMGAQVIVCPTAVAADHPDSYYSVAEKLSREIPNSVWMNQYDNLSNRQAHFETTGPEIWDQTEGKLTHFIVGAGTGGTISGVGRYLKSKNPGVRVWGIDAYGSALKKYHETGIFDESEIYPYITEGIGEDIIPKNFDFSVIDEFIKVTDREGAIGARELAVNEGLLLGYSAGSVVRGIRQKAAEFNDDSIVVMLFHDHGSRYLSKLFNDDWMRAQGFLDE
jgi:cystathionine beta-synthase